MIIIRFDTILHTHTLHFLETSSIQSGSLGLGLRTMIALLNQRKTRIYSDLVL